MPSRKNRIAVTGSQRKAVPGVRVVGSADPTERIEVTVRLRSRPGAATAEVHADQLMNLGRQLPGERQYLSREELAAQRGADPDDLAKVEAFAQVHHLTVVEASAPKRIVRLSGTIQDLSAAFGVKLQKYKAKDIRYRGRTGPVYVPAELADIVEGVFGLDNRPAARPHYRRLETSLKSKSRGIKKKSLVPMNAADGSLGVPEVAKLYNFPAGLNGTGQCIGLIELNTPRDPNFPNKDIGAGFTQSDLNQFFSKLGLPTPTVVSVSVDGGANLPNINPGADGEVTLDIEVAGAVAPGARIAVYFAPNTDKGFIDAVSAAVHDTVRTPSVISISWGLPEDFATPQFLTGLNQVLQDAAAVGVTVCCASGDNGSSDLPDGESDGRLHTDFPSASPFALACGGTQLVGSGTTITSEAVWNEGRAAGAGGGGISNIFQRPAYQAKAKVQKSPRGKIGRGVPDVAGNADPRTGYRVVVGGQALPIGGTSAVAPLWAGLIALINQKLVSMGSQTVGFLNPLIYGPLAHAQMFRDISQGNNDIDGTLHKYKARKGWDACTGWGTPDGTKLLEALGG